MLKKNLLLALFIVFSFFVLGGAVLYNNSVKKQTTNGSPVLNPTGDLHSQLKDYEEVTPPQQSVEIAKIGKAGSDSSAASQSAARSGDSGTKTNIQQLPSTSEAGSDSSADSQSAATNIQQLPLTSGTDPLRTQIEQKYIARLQSLASGYEGRLNALVATALSEYESAKKANPNADIGPLINKYFSAGKALEAECDSQFYSILAAFESELSANSFPLDMAVQARETYEARKGARAGQITSGKN